MATSVVLVEVLMIAKLITYFAHGTDGYTNMSDLDQLIKEKRADYNIFLRPKFNQSEPLVIDMTFDLIAIRDFDEVAEKFSIVGTVYMIWKDDRMSWDPEDYGNLYSFIIEHHDFWTPPFVLVNAFEKFEKVGKDSFWPIRFYHEGDVLYHPGQVFTTTCSVNVELYPWDKQTCELLFTVWGYGPEEIVLHPYLGYDEVSLTYYSDNGEWDLVHTRAENAFENLFRFEFTMKRKPLFIVVNTLIPIVFMSLLNIMAFLIPIESGERISYCITVLLAVAVFLTLISETLPRSATTIAVLCYYLVCVLALSMLIILATVISMRFYFKNETEEVSSYWKALVRFVRCYSCRRPRKGRKYKQKKFSNSKSENSDYIIYRGKDNKPFELQRNELSIVSDIAQAVDSDRFTVMSEKSTTFQIANGHSRTDSWAGATQTQGRDMDDDTITWKDVSCTIDVLCGLLAITCLLGFTVFFFIYTTTMSNEADN